MSYWLEISDFEPVLYDDSPYRFPRHNGVKIQIDENIPFDVIPITPCKSFSIMNTKEFTAKIQNELLEAIKDIVHNMPAEERNNRFGDPFILDIVEAHNGPDIMAIYIEWKKEQEEIRLAQIQDAIDMLERNGYKVERIQKEEK